MQALLGQAAGLEFPVHLREDSVSLLECGSQRGRWSLVSGFRTALLLVPSGYSVPMGRSF